MRILKNMLIIGGASRDVGKTEFLCRLVRRLGGDRELVTLKISGINPGNDPDHGRHGHPPEKFDLLEETCRDGIKDSSKMLLAGASRAFYLRARDECLQEAIDHFFSMVSDSSLIIAESITLRKIIEPGLFVIVKSDREESVKRSFGEVMHLVGLTVISDGSNFDPPPEAIGLDNRGWVKKGTSQ